MTNITISQAISNYLEAIRTRGSKQFFNAHCQALDLFLTFLDAKNHSKFSHISSLRVGWAKDYLSYLQNERSIETEHLYSRAILAFYEYVDDKFDMQYDLISINQHFSENRRPKDHSIPVLPINEIEQLISHAIALSPMPSDTTNNIDRNRLRTLRDKAFILLLADTGLKLTEICSLRRHQLDLSSNTVSIDTIPLPISQHTATAVSKYLQERTALDNSQPYRSPSSLPLFARHDKRASDNILSISRWTGANIISNFVSNTLDSDTIKTLDQENQSITSQSFRHYFVLTALKETDDIELTKTLARHSDASTTRRYLSLLEDNDSSS